MMASRLAMALAVAGVVGGNPSALVSRLGAPKYADREAASAALEKLGPEALSALKSARTSRDAEVRTRAVALVERIESDLLVKPTLVALDFHDRPISEVVAQIGSRGHVRLDLHPREGQEVRSRNLTLVHPEPVPFWTAVEMLHDAAGLELSGGTPNIGFGQGGGRSAAFTLFSLPSGLKPAPASVSGPFRVSLLNLTFHKERNFAGGNHLGMIALPGMNNGGMIQPAAPAGPDRGNGSGQFYANLQVLAEPRMSVSQNGPVRLVEAIDDLGNSLLLPATSGPTFQHNSGYNRFESVAGAAVQTTIPLKFPDRPGRTIKAMRGVVPVTVSARKDDPMVIPLADAKGKTYHNAEISLTIHEVKLDPDHGQTSIDLTVRPLDPASANAGILGQEFLAFRQPGGGQKQFEIADARGGLYQQWYPTRQEQGPDGVRMSLRLIPGEGLGEPTQIRYYDTVRVDTEAEFVFQDVDLF